MIEISSSVRVIEYIVYREYSKYDRYLKKLFMCFGGGGADFPSTTLRVKVILQKHTKKDYTMSAVFLE